MARLRTPEEVLEEGMELYGIAEDQRAWLRDRLPDIVDKVRREQIKSARDVLIAANLEEVRAIVKDREGAKGDTE